MLGNYIVAFVLGILSAYVTTPYVIRFANKIGAIDSPEEKRKIHIKPTARMGGLAIVVSFIFTFIYLMLSMYAEKYININFIKLYKKEFIGIGLSIVLILIMGILDDTRGLNAFAKLGIQSLVAIITILCNIKIQNINVFGDAINFNIALTYLITFAWIIIVMNAINLIDGIDCLSTGIVAIALVSLLVIFKINSSPIIATMLAVCLLGSILGYMPFNKTPAKTFVGDTGTNFLGYMLAVISIMGIAKTYTLGIIIAPLISLMLPILDTAFAILRRIFKSKSIKAVFKADRGHLHHRLLDKGLTQREVVVILYLVTAVAGLLAVLILEGNIYKIISFLVMIAFLSILGMGDILEKKELESSKLEEEKEKKQKDEIK